jgi:hypothetical protein
MSQLRSPAPRRLPHSADGVRPQRLDRLFECLEGVVRTCPECSKKKLPWAR